MDVLVNNLERNVYFAAIMDLWLRNKLKFDSRLLCETEFAVSCQLLLRLHIHHTSVHVACDSTQ